MPSRTLRFAQGHKIAGTTLTVDEVAEDWVSVVDHNDPAGPAVTIYGNHPFAVGALDDLLPGEETKRPWPKTDRVPRDRITSMLVHHGIRGHAVNGITGPVKAHPPRSIVVLLPFRTTLFSAKATTATLREYLPYADATVRLAMGSGDYPTVLIYPKGDL